VSGHGNPLADGVLSALLARRTVMMQGELGDTEAGQLSATLMTLDATGDDHIELRITSATGPIAAALVLVDVVEVLGVPVHTFASGEIRGGPVGVLAAGAKRTMSRHARLRLEEPDIIVAGSAGDIERALADQAARREAFFSHLSACTGRPVDEIRAEWDAGAVLDAPDAVTLGYGDAVVN
jgi:ATP-dependent Clp protease, protease subunit